MKGELPNGYITPAQLAVWTLIAQGRANKEIAADLGSSLRTIEHHRHELYRVLSARNTADLARLAVKHGVIALETGQRLIATVIQTPSGEQVRHLLPEASP